MKRSADTRKILVLCLFSIILLSFVAGVVSAQVADSTDSMKDPISKATSYISDMFTKWTGGYTDVNIAKYSFIVLIMLLIYAILNAGVIPFVGHANWYIKLPISVLIGFLAGAYITPSEVYMLLTSYGALGIILGGIIPFIIVSFFTIELGKEDAMGGKAISILVWIAFIIFIGIKAITGMAEEKIKVWEGVIYLILVLGGFIFIFAYNYITLKLFKSGVNQGILGSEMMESARIEGKITNLIEEQQGITGMDKDAIRRRALLQHKIEALREVLNSIGNR